MVRTQGRLSSPGETVTLSTIHRTSSGHAARQVKVQSRILVIGPSPPAQVPVQALAPDRLKKKIWCGKKKSEGWKKKC